MNKGLLVLGIGALILFMSNSKKRNLVYYGPGGNPNESNPNQQGIPFIKK